VKRGIPDLMVRHKARAANTRVLCRLLVRPVVCKYSTKSGDTSQEVEVLLRNQAYRLADTKSAAYRDIVLKYRVQNWPSKKVLTKYLVVSTL